MPLDLAPPDPGVPRLTNPTQVTVALGVEDYPTWAPDGISLAYAANPTGIFRGGNWDIWVTQVGGGQALNRTSEYAGLDSLPGWFPDGRQIAFHSDRDGGGIFAMSPLAGPPRRVIAPDYVSPAEWSSSPQWSSDGARLAYLDPKQVVIVAAFSPDGTKLAYSDGRRVANLWRVPILTEGPSTWDDAEQLTFDQALISSVNISSDLEPATRLAKPTTLPTSPSSAAKPIARSATNRRASTSRVCSRKAGSQRSMLSASLRTPSSSVSRITKVSFWSAED